MVYLFPSLIVFLFLELLVLSTCRNSSGTMACNFFSSYVIVNIFSSYHLLLYHIYPDDGQDFQVPVLLPEKYEEERVTLRPALMPTEQVCSQYR